MSEFRAIHRSFTAKLYKLASGAIALPILLSASNVQAEGSKELTSSGGYRPFLEFRNDVAAGFLRKTIIKVYAEAGETIELGSSAVGIGQGKIEYRKPNGGPTLSCGGAGLIANRTEEVNQTFTPCSIPVGAGESGIWEIDFVSPNPNNQDNPTPRIATANWVQEPGEGHIAAWDVAVKNAGAPVLGRVYANYFAFNMGTNRPGALSPSLVVLTDQGYRYRIDFNGLDPYGFILFSNNKGFRDSSGNPIFRSLQYAGPNPGVVPSGFSFQDPNAPDTASDITHKLFINDPDPNMPSSASSPAGLTWLYSNPVPPPVPQNFTFVGIEGTNGQAGTLPLGGNFTFDHSGVVNSSYSITLDLNQDGIFGNSNDRTFLGTATPGPNSVPWDGLDGNGTPIPASNNSYGAQINLYAGEAHFPMVDAENNSRGIIIERLNVPTGLPNTNRFDVHYDDRNSGSSTTDFTLCANGEAPGGITCYGSGPNPRSALAGINSAGGAHRFTGNFGDRRGIDTWVYYPSADVLLSGGIAIKEADLVLTKTDNATTVAPGDSLTYVITVENQGPSDVVDATFEDNLPSDLTNISWTCAITSGTGNCGSASGTANAANQISTTVDLNKDAIATYTISTQVSPNPSSSSINNTGTVKRPDDVTDPDDTNNSDSDTTTINILLDLTLVKRITAIGGSTISSYVDDLSGAHAADDNHPNWPIGSNAAGISDFLSGAINGNASPGEELEYTIYFLSSGNFPLTNVNLCDWIPANTTYVANSAELFIGGSTTSSSSQFITAGTAPTVPCAPGSNTNGAVVVNVVDSANQLPAATGPGTPSNSHGYIRFRVTVN